MKSSKFSNHILQQPCPFDIANAPSEHELVLPYTIIREGTSHKQFYVEIRVLLNYEKCLVNNVTRVRSKRHLS